jgi:hypothetical protein
MRRTARVAQQPSIVRFYKMDHLGDPVPLRDGRIHLGVQNCKGKLRAGIKPADLDRRDNLVIAIGGRVAKDGLRDRLCWGGIALRKLSDGVVEFDDGFYLAQRGPVDWRERFPLIAKYVDRVYQGHRVRNIPPRVREEFTRLYEWGKQVEARIGRTPVPKAILDPPCPPLTPPRKKPRTRC